jgi:hypothetical protein
MEIEEQVSIDISTSNQETSTVVPTVLVRSRIMLSIG